MRPIPCGLSSLGIMIGLTCFLGSTGWSAEQDQSPTDSNIVNLDGRDFVVPAGFTLQRISRPELVQRPIVADFDSEGHLFVADSSGTNDDVQTQLRTLPHRILRLTDDDGDGRFDSSTVFADQMMFPEGVLCHRGAVFVSAPPLIWKLMDANHDGICDQREPWFDGRTLTGCANDLHGPYLGPDGWIYWCKGAFAEQTYERPGGESWTTRAAHIFRRRFEGGEIESVMTGGMDNPVEVAFSKEGERFFTTTFFQHPAGGQRDGLIHAIYGGVYGKQHSVIDGHPRTGPLMPVLVHLGAAAPSGLARLESDALGRDYPGSLVAACFNLHQVTRHVLRPVGAGYATDVQNLVSTPDLDFHPTDVLEDADGSVVVVDTGGWYKLCCPTSQLHKPDVLGAIYRLRRTDGSPVNDARGRQISWATETADSLVDRLADPRPAVSKRAGDELATRFNSSAGVSALSAVLEKTTNDLESTGHRERIAWALTRNDTIEARGAIRKALNDPAETVRRIALHSISVRRDKEASTDVHRLLVDPHPAVRRVAAETIGRTGTSESISVILKSLCSPDVRSDRVLEHSLLYALIEIGDVDELRRQLNARPQQPEVEAALLLALDQSPSGSLQASEVLPSLRSDKTVLRTTASWILARHVEWGVAYVTDLSQRIARGELVTTPEPNAEGSVDDSSDATLRSLIQDASVQDAIGKWWQTAPRDGAKDVSIWRALAEANPEKLTTELQRGLAAQMSLGDAAVDAFILSALATGRAALDESSLQNNLRRLVLDETRPVDQRLRAASLQPSGLPLDQPLFDLLLKTSVDETQPMARPLAVRGLTQAKLEPRQLNALIHVLPAAGPVELAGLLQAFKDLKEGAFAEQLVRALAQAPALAVLPPATIRDALGHLDAQTRKPLDDALARLHAEVADQPARLQRLLASLPGGDIRRGQAVFHSAKAACFSCHGMGYRGGEVGPDLTRIGQVRSRRDLLEAIVFPSASFVRSFEPFTVVTTTGEVHQGVIRDDQPNRLTLLSDQRKRVEIARDQIEEVRPSKVSVMPSGLDQLLTDQELSDLVTFLEAAK